MTPDRHPHHVSFTMLRVILTTLIALASLGCGGPYSAGWGDAHALHRAAYEGDAARLRGELAKGVSPNEPAHVPKWSDYFGRYWPETSALNLAIDGRQCEAIGALLDAGATAQPQILQLIIAHCPEYLGEALRRGIPTDYVYPFWDEFKTHGTPLQVAATYNAVGAADQLLQAGASVTARGEWGETALHDAASSGSLEMTQWLLDHGADPLARDNWGRTPFHDARDTGSNPENRAAILAMLEQATTASGRAVPTMAPRQDPR